MSLNNGDSHSLLSPLDFTLAPQEVSVNLGDGKAYILKEASEADAAEWRNACQRAARMQDGKVVGVDGLGGVQALLVSRCLWERTGAVGPDGRPQDVRVPPERVRSWPARVVRPLYDRARLLSDLDERPETEAELVKAIAEMQEKLTALRAGKPAPGTPEERAGNSHDATPITSA